MSKEFIETYEEIQRRNRRGVVSPARALALWRGFVRSCETGYDQPFADYFSDVRIRGSIELALRDPVLASLDGYARFRDAVHEMDDRFRRVATVRLPFRNGPHRPPEDEWWSLVVPARAEEELARFLQEEYGVAIEIVP
ncbi:hypothetical protein ACIHCQ_29190 [Streptomyces sp. NPDC052236]|uniref:hypothetical protein n=1 Tax=Streptomyces sp. NPDC052236 TaxID=3365686 RepID=UPI0037D75A93